MFFFLAMGLAMHDESFHKWLLVEMGDYLFLSKTEYDVFQLPYLTLHEPFSEPLIQI
jgi:hypothetical protein